MSIDPNVLNEGIIKLVTKRINGDVMVYDPIEGCFVKWCDLVDAKKRFIVSGYYAECIINGLNNVLFDLESVEMGKDDVEIINLLFKEAVWFFRKAFIRSNAMGLPGRDGIKEFKELLDSMLPNNPHMEIMNRKNMEVNPKNFESKYEEIERKKAKIKKSYDAYEKYMEEDENGVPHLKPKYKLTETTTNTRKHQGNSYNFHTKLDLHELDSL